MSSKFEKEMYNFIVDENNFDLALEISNLLPDIQDKLVEEFWQLVVKRLEELDSYNIWNFNLDGDFVDIRPKDKHLFFYSFFELKTRPWMAIWLDEGGDKMLGVKTLEELELMKNLKEAKGNDKLAYLNHHENIRNKSFQKSIIPSRREQTVNEMADWIWNFMAQHEIALNILNSNE